MNDLVSTDLEALVRRVMTETPFMKHLAVRVDEMAIGRLQTRMALRPELLQQHGFAHAGVIASLADHTAGSCAGTHGSIEKGTNVLSIEFKINMLAPARGEPIWSERANAWSGAGLLCRATTLRIGSRIAVVESEVFCAALDMPWSQVSQKMLCAKATVTLSVR
jgi:uncharacterized protein (TIGR00369 family)